MKLSIKLLLAAALLTTATYSFAKPANVTATAYVDSQDRNLSGFKSVSLSGSFDYFITQGSTESVKIEGPKNVLSSIITEVKGGVLKVYTKSNTKWGNIFSNGDAVAIRITVKDINSIELSGSGDVFFKNGINTSSLRISLSGSGDISGKINVKRLETSITGSGDISVSGRAETSLVSVVGSGDFSGRGLATGTTTVKVVGSGDAEVNASTRLDASVSGSGDIHYSGSPKTVNKSVAGSGDIEGD